MPRVTIVFPHRNAISETFIHAHVAGLPGVGDILTQGYLPTQALDGSPIASQGMQPWLRRWAWRMVRGLNHAEVTTAELARRFRRLGAQVVLAEYGDTGVAIMDACRWSGVPLVVHFHGYDAYISSDVVPALRRYPDLFRVAAGLVVVSRHMQEQLLRLGAPEARVHLNPYGVDVDAFAGADPASAAPDFVAVGRFVEKKAPWLTLAAFREVLRACPSARLCMVGEGPLLPGARQLARGWGIQESVTFTGALSPPEVARRMRAARAFVQHSVRAENGDHEGLPVAVLEAAASGLPVVATRHGGICDAVLEGETGWLRDSFDVAGMAADMLALATDPALAARMGQAGRQHVRAHFTRERSLAGLADILAHAAREAR